MNAKIAWFASLVTVVGAPAAVAPAASHYAKGVRLHRSGDLNGALASYTSACAVDPRHARAQQFRGQLLLTSEPPAYAAAAEAYAAAIAAQPGLKPQPPVALAKLHNNHGAALVGAGRSLEAVAAYRSALTLNPVDGDAGRNLHDLKAALRAQLLDKGAKAAAAPAHAPARENVATSGGALAAAASAIEAELRGEPGNAGSAVRTRSVFHATPFFAIGAPTSDDKAAGGATEADEDEADGAGEDSSGFADVLPRAQVRWLNGALLRCIRTMRSVHSGVSASNHGGGWQSPAGLFQS